MSEEKSRICLIARGAATAVIGAGMILVQGCGEDPSSEGGADNGQSSTVENLSAGRKGSLTTLHRGNVAEPDTLDPHKMSTVYENVIGRDLFCTVAIPLPDGTIVPDCAQSWDISEDGLTYTFHIRSDIKWSDGKPVTAHDFVAGLRRVMDPNTASEQAAILDMVKNAVEVSYGRVPVEELGVSAPDDLTLVVKLERPSPSFIPIYSGPRGAPLPRHVFAKYGDSWVRPANIVSNGPFLLEDWRPHEYVKVVKNQDFYKAGKVKLEEIYYYPTDEYNAAVKRFRAGELDLNTQLPTQQVDFLRKILPGSVRIIPGLSVTYVIVNHEKAPFDDLRVRRALSLAIDREIITERVMRMGETPAYRMTPYSVSNYDGPDPAYKNWTMEKRKAEAVRLLAEAGFGPDNPLSFEYRIRATADGKRHAVAITSMWKDIGVKPEILGTEVKVHYNDLQSSNFFVADAGWQALDNPENFLYLARTEAGVQNYGNYSSARFDALMNEALQIADITKRYAMMAQAEAVMIEEQGIIPLYFSTNRNLVAPYVQGYQDNATDSHPSIYMWIDLGDNEPLMADN